MVWTGVDGVYDWSSMKKGTKSAVEYGLAFETSSAIGSVAIGHGVEVLESRTLSRPKAHAAEFIPTIKALGEAHHVDPFQIKRVYVSSGPGSFTGLRIGVTAARMLAFGVKTKLVAVPTLEVIAQNALQADPPPAQVAVILDAKRGHVYAGAFLRKGDNYVATGDPVEADPLSFLAAQARECAVLGEAVLFHRSAVERSTRRILSESLYRPRAETVYRLGFGRAEKGEFSPPRNFVPTYIRAPEPEEVWAKKAQNNSTGALRG